MSNKRINIDNLQEYNKQMQEAYIKPLADKLDGLNIKNGEGEASIKSPDVENQLEEVEGFPEGRLNKVIGTQGVALGAAHKVTKRGGIALGAYGNIQTRFSAGIGYSNYTSIGTDEEVEVGYGDGNIALGDGNAVTSKEGSIAIGTSNKIGYLIRLTKEERDEILTKRIKYEGDNIKEVVGDFPDKATFPRDILFIKDGKEYYKKSTGIVGVVDSQWTYVNVGTVQEGCTQDILGSRAIIKVTNLPSVDIDTEALYLILNGSNYDQYRYINKEWKLVCVGTSNVNIANIIRRVRPDPGYTYGGYREDTIYLQQTHITASGRSSYKLLTEQRLQNGEYWTDPNTTVSYVDENGKTKTYIAICKLVSKKANGSGEFIGAVALGYGNRVTDTGAVATGAGTWADGFASFSAGEDTEAHGNRATVFGYDNLVYGNNAFVAGTHHDLKGSSVAGSNDDITIFGRWSQNKENLLFAVGNGTEQYRLKSDTSKLITPTQYKALSETEQANYERNRKNAFEIFKDGTIVGAGVQLYLHTFTKFHDEGPGWTEEFRIISTSDKQMTYEYIANDSMQEGDGIEHANFGSIDFHGYIIAAEYNMYSEDYYPGMTYPPFLPPIYNTGFTATIHDYIDWANPMYRRGIEVIGGKRVDSVLGTETMKSSVRPL